MKVLITGANSFIGRNLRVYLQERSDVQLVCYTRDDQSDELPGLLQGVSFVFHLAGVNRPKDPKEFETGNAGSTRDLCMAVTKVAHATGKAIPILYTSSMQAAQDNAYGRSKLNAEGILMATGRDPLVPVHLFRLPNVFGKWSRPNYNSVVATFCHNVAHDLPIVVNDPEVALTLVYIDDVVSCFGQVMDGAIPVNCRDGFVVLDSEYTLTVGELAKLICSFRESRSTLMIDKVGVGLVRALYATYVSFLPTNGFSYEVPKYVDPRGVFVEMFKTPDCGQLSYFTAHPGITRGGHYHHTKTEKFLVIKGQALFRFRHLLTAELVQLRTSGDKPQVVDTIPGWAHDITNVGEDEMLVMLWANENFDRQKPDTVASKV